jgi:hypothetical protein
MKEKTPAWHRIHFQWQNRECYSCEKKRDIQLQAIQNCVFRNLNYQDFKNHRVQETDHCPGRF